MERVVCVVKAALRNMWNRKPRTYNSSNGGYNGPVNLPEGLAAAMRKTHSYMWLDNAVGDESTQLGGGESSAAPTSTDAGECRCSEDGDSGFGKSSPA